MALGSKKTWDNWIDEYAQSHQHPINKACHFIGIPMIIIALLLFPLCFRAPILWRFSIAFFLIGWIFQFVGHAFEGKPPEFFKDWRFLFVGARWWLRKILKTKS
ncbi:MAG: DUF962 domain-containing protein [Agarilytica sp.]